jgi:putative membrane protein
MPSGADALTPGPSRARTAAGQVRTNPACAPTNGDDLARARMRAMAFVIRVLINAVAIWFTTLIVPGLSIEGAESTNQKILIIIGIALVFGIVNAILKPIIHVIAFPLYVLTLGLLTLVVNAALLELTAWITKQTSWHLVIDNFGTAIIAALIISVVSFVLSILIPGSQRR